MTLSNLEIAGTSRRRTWTRHSFICALLSALVMGALLCGCDPGQGGYTIQVVPEPEQQSAAGGGPGGDSGQAGQPVDEGSSSEPMIWPPLKDGGEVEIAADLLAENYYIVLDASGSMAYTVGNHGGEKRIDAAREAVIAFLRELPREANLGLLSFQPTRELVALGPNNHQAVASNVQKLIPQGKTPLYRAMSIGYNALEEQARRQSGYGSYKLIVVTDGESNDDDPAPLARWIVENSPVEVHVIGFAISEHSLNIPGYTRYVTANSREELVRALTDTTRSESEAFDVLDFNNQ